MAEEKFDWNQLEEAKKNLVKRAEAFKKAFIQMPGGAPAEGGMPADAAGLHMANLWLAPRRYAIFG